MGDSRSGAHWTSDLSRAHSDDGDCRCGDSASAVSSVPLLFHPVCVWPRWKGRWWLRGRMPSGGRLTAAARCSLFAAAVCCCRPADSTQSRPDQTAQRTRGKETKKKNTVTMQQRDMTRHSTREDQLGSPSSAPRSARDCWADGRRGEPERRALAIEQAATSIATAINVKLTEKVEEITFCVMAKFHED